jgi:hypothetical protein
MKCFFSFLKGVLLGTRSFLLTNVRLLLGIGGEFLIEHAGGLVLSSFCLVKGPEFLVPTLFFLVTYSL